MAPSGRESPRFFDDVSGCWGVEVGENGRTGGREVVGGALAQCEILLLPFHPLLCLV